MTAVATVHRTPLAELGLGAGKKTRLRRILFDHGLRNGTALFLPYDQGFEHGPRDFFANPPSADPRYVLRLARDGGFNGIVLHVGLAEKFYWDYAGEIPLVLKLNGKTDIPPDDDALSPLQASVADAVRLGADAVGYTLYVGTPAAERDFTQFRQVREDATRLGMPLIVWSYPRGSAVAAKGGRDGFYAVDYAARVAAELGADVVKLGFPHPERVTGVPAPYGESFTSEQAAAAVVHSAGRTMTIIAGGGHADDEVVLTKARQAMQAGATGLIFGRNIWQRDLATSLRFVEQLRRILEQYPGSVSEPGTGGAPR